MFRSFLKKFGVLPIIWAGLLYPAYADLDRPLTPIEPTALVAAGIRSLQQTDPNLNGSGTVIAAVCRSMTYYDGVPQNDYRFNMRHQSLANGDILFEDQTDGKAGISSHASAIGGILVGLDPYAELPAGQPVEYRGVVPNASVDVYEFWRFAGLWMFAQKPVPADVITLSLGDVFESWWTRGIEQLADDQGTVIVAAIGNGQAARDTTLYPAAGANVIGVGVIDSAVDENGSPSLSEFALPTARHSSHGPTYDLRSKPDLVAPGTAFVPDAFSEKGYTVLSNASSLAAPTVAGTAALLLQKTAQDESLTAAMANMPKNCIIKAILMNTARKMPWWHKGQSTESDDAFTPLDALQGAGALDAAAALAQLTAGQQAPGDVSPLGWDTRPLGPDETLYYVIEADPNATLTATLTWNRHYENRYPFSLKPEQSNLRLELWAVDPLEPAGAVLLETSDSPVDTVEHLWTPLSAQYTRYMIAVRFGPDTSMPTATFERFALAWSVGPDTSREHLYWNDLNGDGKIDTMDQLIRSLLIQYNGNAALLEPAFYQQALHLSPERLDLLTMLWHRWKPYLTAESQSVIEQ